MSRCVKPLLKLLTAFELRSTFYVDWDCCEASSQYHYTHITVIFDFLQYEFCASAVRYSVSLFYGVAFVKVTGYHETR